MPLSPKTRRGLTVGGIAVGLLLSAAFGFQAVRLWKDGSTNSPVAIGKDAVDGARGTPSDGPTGLPTASSDTSSTTADSKGAKAKLLGSGDPFANSFGAAKLYQVKLVINTDGAGSVGYRYRDGKGEGQQVIDRSLTLNRTVRGPLPVSQIGVQVLSNATYATCTIYIDGVKVATRTAKKPGYVAVCTN